MPIEIFSIENLNWDNGSYKVPNAKPTVFKDRKTVKVIPSITNYYGGSVPLTGDHWNWCEYKGVYYFLKRDRPLDTTNKNPKKHRWLYFLIRDHWTNSVLTNKVTIKGDISTWNIEKDIEENLNRTSLIIENPLGIARVCFDKVDANWRNALNLFTSRQGITNDFKEIYLTKNTIDFLLSKIELVRRFKTTQQYLYSHRKDLFLFANLKPTYANSAWKTEVKKRVNKALEELVDNPEAILGKVNVGTGGFNALTGHYCFTYERDAIGYRDDTVQVNNIDLSKVTDIKRISWDDLKSTRTDNIFTIETALLDIALAGRNADEERQVFKLSQRNYLPLGQDVLQGRWYPPRRFSKWNNTNPGQRITLNKQNNKELKLYYVDQIKFFLSWYEGEKEAFDAYWQDKKIRDYWVTTHKTGTFILQVLTGFGIGTYAAKQAKAGRNWIYTVGYGQSSDKASWVAHKGTWNPNNESYTKLKEIIRGLTKLGTYYRSPDDYYEHELAVDKWTPEVLPHTPISFEANRNKFLWNKFETSPSYGFLIWQIQRPRSEWRLFEYLGEKSKDTVEVVTGINQETLNKEYSLQQDGNKKDWWRRVNNNHYLSRFTGQTEFARLYLDLWQLNFLHFFPTPNSPRDFEQQRYKCDYSDYWYGIDQFLYQKKDCETVKLLDEQNLKDLDGNKIANPWNEDDYGAYAKTIESKLDKVVLKEELKLPQPLEEGDYLISSLEYRWDNYDYRHWTSRKDFLSWIKPNAWEAETFNLLEDFATINYSSRTRRDVSLEDEVNWKNTDDAQIFLGADLDGDISFFTCYRFEQIHRLSNNPDQYIQEVDGQDHKRIKYYHFKKAKINIDRIDQDTGLIDLISTFYEVVAKRNIRKNEERNLILWDQLKVSDLDIETGNLFDLIGSDWYVFIRGEKVHFIYKKPTGSAISPLVQNTNSFKYPKDEEDSTKFSNSEGIKTLKDLPLVAKVNQINTLYYKSYPVSIKTKFLFDKNKKDSIPLATIEGIDTKDKPTTYNNYIFKFVSDYDNIEQTIDIYKEPVKQRSIADQTAVDELLTAKQLMAVHADVQRRELGLDQKISDSSFRRQEFDLSLEETYKRLNDVITVSGHATSIAPGILKHIPLIGKGLANIAQGWGNNIARVGITAGLEFGKKDKFGLPKLADATQGGFFGSPQTLNNSVWYNHVQPEKARRIEEDKNFKFQQFAFSSYKIDLSYREKRLQHAMAMNRLAHQWVQEPVNDAFISEYWKDKKNLTDFYMLVRYPTGIQLEQLQEHVEDFGFDIDLPDRTITLRAGMTPNVIRMANVDIDHMSGIENILDREYLAKRLEAGIKIYSMEDQEAQGFDYFETSIYIPEIKFKEYENLEKKVENLEKELEHCKKESKFKGQYWIKNFDKALKVIKEDADNTDKLKEQIENVTREIEIAEQTPEKYDEEVIGLYKDLLEALKTEYEQALNTIKTRKDLEDTKKRAEAAENENKNLQEDLQDAHNKEKSLLNEQQALHANLADTRKKLDDTENERDNLREELNKAHNKARDLLNKTDDCEKKKREYEGYIASLKDLNKTWTEFAKQLNIGTSTAKLDPTRPLDNVEEVKKIQADLLNVDKQFKLQGDLLKQELDRTKAELQTTKTELQQTKTDLGKCKAASRRDTVSASRQIRGWTYCDLLRTFQSLNWNYMEIYKIIVNSELYGFSCDEYWNLVGIPTLQAIQQTVEECEDLLANNVHFMHQDSEALRNFLLTEEGADKIRGMKRWFVANWAKMWSYRTTHNETIDRGNWQIKKSTFYDANISFDYPMKEQQIRAANNFMWYNENIDNDNYAESPLALKVLATKYWKNIEIRKAYEAKEKGIKVFKDSFARAKSWWVVRARHNWNDNYSSGYFRKSFSNEVLIRWTTGSGRPYDENWIRHVMISKIFRAIDWNFTNKFFYEKISKRSIGSYELSANAQIRVWGNDAKGDLEEYKGFSNRKFFWGYLLVFLDFYYENKLIGYVMPQQAFEFHNISMAKRWINKLGMQTHEWEKQVLYPMKISYEALCNRMSFEDAQAKIEKELADEAATGS